MNVNPMTPLTAVKLLRGVPLDSSYTDIMDFANVNAQTAYFSGKAKFNFNNMTPVRMQNSIRVPVNADSVYDCNYLMFQNANFNTKWFYAFITAINFINVNMCEITFELDVIQTWWFDIKIHPCYVEREHITLDTYGLNTIAENLELGDVITYNQGSTGFFDSYVAVIATAYADNPGGYQGGMYSGLNFIAGRVDDSGDVARLNDYLNSAIEAYQVDAITNIFMMPTAFYTTGSMPSNQVAKVAKPSTLGGYTPKNKKLLTYPYCFLLASTLNDSAVFKYERFSSDTCDFTLNCAMSCDPEIGMTPVNYDGAEFNYDATLMMKGFPQCAFSVDSYKAWLAQNSSSVALTALAGGVATTASLVTGNVAGAIGGFTGLASTLNAVVMESAKPPQSRGRQGSSTFVGTRTKNFYFYRKGIKPEYAKTIDDYFTMYGYQTNELKQPNIIGRQSWNYVKTNEAKITGSVPFEDIERIKQIFNNGVTIWHGDWVGDYARDNNPIWEGG